MGGNPGDIKSCSCSCGLNLLSCSPVSLDDHAFLLFEFLFCGQGLVFQKGIYGFERSLGQVRDTQLKIRM